MRAKARRAVRRFGTGGLSLGGAGGRIGDLPPGMEIEVSEARWVPLDDAPAVLSYRGEREMAERARDALEEAFS